MKEKSRMINEGKKVGWINDGKKKDG